MLSTFNCDTLFKCHYYGRVSRIEMMYRELNEPK